MNYGRRIPRSDRKDLENDLNMDVGLEGIRKLELKLHKEFNDILSKEELM